MNIYNNIPNVLWENMSLKNEYNEYGILQKKIKIKM